MADQSPIPKDKDIGINDGRAVIENGALVIRLSLESLPQVVEGAWATGNLDRFDAAINEALEQGAEGIEEHEDQDA